MTPAGLRAARKRLGFTQHELAEALHMGRWGFQSVGKWERGEKPIPPRMALTIKGLEAERK